MNRSASAALSRWATIQPAACVNLDDLVAYCLSRGFVPREEAEEEDG
jgi:hypothetical protein